jgi:hypothetical protein
VSGALRRDSTRAPLELTPTLGREAGSDRRGPCGLLVVGGLSLTLAACSSDRGPTFPTSERFPDAPRKAPSFAAEPPAAGAQAGASEKLDDDSALRVSVPLDSDEAREFVGRFFTAVLAESLEKLSLLLAQQAWTVSDAGRQPALPAWRARFAQLDYTSLNGQIVAAPSTLRTYTFATASRAKSDGVPTPTSQNEVVVVARPTASWTGKPRLFGAQLAFRLRPMRDSRRFEIAEIVEDFRLP